MSDISIQELIESHHMLAEYTYEQKKCKNGYNNRTLFIDLSNMAISSKPVSEEMKNTFTGGKGFCLWLLWNGTKPSTKWDSPENELVFSSGPIGGITSYPGSGKVTVTTISPLTHSVVDSNGGGYFGPYLKFSGWDALEIQGKAEQDVIIFIDGDNGVVKVEAAPLDPIDTHLVNTKLTEMYADDEKDKKNISVISAGQAAAHIPICGLNISYYDPKKKEVRFKQAARGGAGTVLRDKKIKAIVVKFSDLNADSNGVADMALLRKAGSRINKEISDFDASQNDMRGTGTPYLVEIMNRFDLLPTHNFQYGSHPDAYQIAGDIWKQKFNLTGPDGCWYGCSMSCAHGVSHYHLRTGPYMGDAVFVDGPEYETLGGLGSNIGVFNPEDILELNFYADTYGIDTISLGNSIAFAMECYSLGILDKEKTGGLELTWGNAEAAIELVHQMASGEGFGVVVGQGVRSMKKVFAEKFSADSEIMQDIGMEIKGMEISEYISKESITQQGGFALASKGAQHDEAWLIFMEMVHKQLPTFEDKAEALHYFPMWRTWFSLHGLCKLPWNDIIPESNKTAKEPAKVPEHLENYTWLYEGVLGEKITPDEIIEQSEKVYNFQRLFNLRVGFGTREHDYPPYRAMGPVTRDEYESRVERYDSELKDVGINIEGLSSDEKIKALRDYREGRYEKLVNAVYKRRGWSENGIPTIETAKRLKIDYPEIVELIQQNM
ncbi:MAG TPA: aldehyde ferredoxin oxidoreductase C-terminal domain-containing protein [Anaerolineaceae bacterium]|nr:aldehyde ferredoxin oxidoreductase C-terminal domain-containing protein [Anaerolineaceae bacterium]